MEILSRLLMTAVIIGAGILFFRLINRRVLRRAETKMAGMHGFKPGKPAVLYFTTENCIPCKTVQRPALEALEARLGRDHFQLIQIDAFEQTDLADYWGVLSVPTTFVIDSQGRPRRINHGVTRENELYDQLLAVERERMLELATEQA